jgi:hypothetical protein
MKTGSRAASKAGFRKEWFTGNNGGFLEHVFIGLSNAVAAAERLRRREPKSLLSIRVHDLLSNAKTAAEEEKPGSDSVIMHNLFRLEHLLRKNGKLGMAGPRGAARLQSRQSVNRGASHQ